MMTIFDFFWTKILFLDWVLIALRVAFLMYSFRFLMRLFFSLSLSSREASV